MSTRITIEGILVNTPELRETPNGVKVTTLRILDNPARRVNGEWQKIATTAYEVTVWQNLAETVVAYFSERDLVTVTAYNVYVKPWQGREGNLGADIKATAESVAMRHRPVSGGASAAEPEGPEETKPAKPAKPRTAAKTGKAGTAAKSPKSAKTGTATKTA